MFLIIGTGLIAEEYMKCLGDQKVEFEIIGNTKTKSQFISNKYNQHCYCGGFENFDFRKTYENVIIATPIEFLYNHLKICIEQCKGIQNIFVEKPGCLNTYQMKDIISIKNHIHIFIAYNRRFLSSVINGKEITINDPIKELKLTINEYKLDDIAKIKSNEIMQSWFLNMTTHVVDLAFFLTGMPEKLNVLEVDGYGELEYHKKGCIFKGNGITEKNIQFEYNGDWSKSGKWKMDLHLESGKILSYQPLEELKIINLDRSEEIIPKNQIDTDYKPGYYNQIKSFMTNKQDLLTIERQYDNQLIFHKMIGQNPDFYNVLLIGCGNIGFRHLNAFANTNLPLKMHIVELNDDNINKARDYIKGCERVDVEFYKDVNDIVEPYFDVCTIATCSDVRLMLIKRIIGNDKIKYVSNMILEKVTFQSMRQFKEYDELIKKFKNCNTFISTHARYVYENEYFNLFKDPKINITGGKWGLMCNSIHFIVFLLHFKKDFSFTFNQTSDIIDSKRNSFKEIYGQLYNDDICISCSDNDDKLNIIFTENKHKLVIKVSNQILFSYYEDDVLVSEFSKDFLHTSVYFESEYKNLLLNKDTTLCRYDMGRQSHKILFDAIQSSFGEELFPIT